MKRATKILFILPLVARAGLAAGSGAKRDVGPHYFRVQEAREGQVRVARFHAGSPIMPQDFLPVLITHMHQSCGTAAPELITHEQNLERRQGRNLLVSAEARFRCGDGQ